MKIFFGLFLLLTVSLSSAEALNKNNVPEPLKPWVDWVLYDDQQRQCLDAYHNEEMYSCTWPSYLDVTVYEKEIAFEQKWEIMQKTWVRLPGSSTGRQWTRNVKINEQEIPVLNKDGFPYVELSKGSHTVYGSLPSKSGAGLLTIPPKTGLVRLYKSTGDVKTRIELFDQSAKGVITIGKAPKTTGKSNGADEIQVFRKIQDGVPLKISTRIILNISGDAREIIIPNIKMAGFTPFKLKSNLPSRLNAQGDLSVQVRAGKWQVNLESYIASPVATLTPPDVTYKDWPKQEIWLFEPNSDLRLTEISGVSSIDASQTRVPKDWQKYAAYLLTNKQTMQIKTLQRGNANPKPNKLILNRDLWLDFSGKSYTSHDTISGTMTRGWRLSVMPEIELGSAAVNGNPQLITELKGGSQKGVELRTGVVNLQTDSRHHYDISTIPVTGWQEVFQKARTNLYLPPGWKIFSATGSDNTPNTWLQRWTLLDLFIILVIAIAIGRMWQWYWGVFTLFTMALIWHEPDAPQYIWLNILVAVALLRILPSGTFKTGVWWYRNIVLLFLAVQFIPFAVSEVRGGLYPQLSVKKNHTRTNSFPEVASMESSMGSSMDYSKEIYSKSRKILKKSKAPAYKEDKLRDEVDENANIQTGPGLPNWNKNNYMFEWNSPIEKEQTLRLVFITPSMTLVLNFLRVFCLLVLIWLLTKSVVFGKDKPAPSGGDTRSPWFKRLLSSRNAKAMATVLLPLMLFVSHVPEAQAKKQVFQGKVAQEKVAVAPSNTMSLYPSEHLLETLKARLLEPDKCLPYCAEYSAIRVAIKENNILTIALDVHSSKTTMVPLPVSVEQWHASLITLNSIPAAQLLRDGDGLLWVVVEKGVTTIYMEGELPDRGEVQFNLSAPRPQNISIKGSSDWKSSWNAKAKFGFNFKLQRTKQQLESNNKTGTNTFAPLFEVERTLSFGLDWTVETRVKRLSPLGKAVTLTVPLLENEHVLSNIGAIKNGDITVSLSAKAKEIIWKSRLDVQNKLVLTAIDKKGMVEKWRLYVSPRWHIESSGVPQIHNASDTREWLPEWQPWPKEVLTLHISKPNSIAGQTLTVDRSNLVTTLGKRNRESDLTLQLRSSRGGQHTILLPEKAELLSITSNSKLLPVRQENRKVDFPIVPGKQSVVLKWREKRDIATYEKLSPVDMGIASVNHDTKIKIARDRWVLFLGGPQMGPAVLFWGTLLVILIGSILLGKSKVSPLRTWQWFLLGFGMSLATPLMIIVVVAWFIALQYRPKLQNIEKNTWFNAMQVGFVILTLVMFLVLFYVLQQGLLGWPDMQVVGNSSNAYNLNWYQDRIANELPQPWVVSVPLLAYRLIMLLWALWLAFSLISWLKWGWEKFSTGGVWRNAPKKTVKEPKEVKR